MIEGPICIKCGKKVKNDNIILCHDCENKEHAFERGFSVFEYQMIKESLYRFKYAGRAEYAQFYADKTIEYLGDTLGKLQAEALVPVPLHYTRQHKRGYNQAEVYAKKLSAGLNIPVLSGYVKRRRKTTPLKKLSREERQNNLKRAFIITRNDVKLNTIIVIDDIYTTGATIDAVASVLKRAGVKRIFFLTIASGNGI